MICFINIQHIHVQSYTVIYIHIHSYNYINDDEWDDEHLPSGNQYIGGDSWGLNGVCMYIYIHNGGNLDPTRTYQDLPFQWDGI